MRFLMAFISVTAFTSITLADCDWYWTGEGYTWRCEEPSPVPTGPNCHWETNTSGKQYWVCN